MWIERLTIVAQDINRAFTALPQARASEDRVTTIIDQVFIAAGILAVLFIIIGGIRYSASRGNPDQVAQAKNTIIYAFVGLAVTLFSYVIVRFVVSRLIG